MEHSRGPNLSYWKSNPYLTSKFTGEDDSLHPQWVIVDLKAEPVSAIRIGWGSPYATTYQVEYWVGKRALDFDAGPQGEWKTFPSGAVKGVNPVRARLNGWVLQYLRVVEIWRVGAAPHLRHSLDSLEER